MGAAGGGGGIDWAALATGDLYQGGRVYKPASNTFQVWYYPESRKVQGISYTLQNKTGSFEVRGQSNLKIYLVGGGAGGLGENGHGGGGGGAYTTNSFTPTDGETFNLSAGRGGRGGVNSTTSAITGLGDATNRNEDGASSYVVGSGLDILAYGGTKGARTSNSSNTSDMGQGGGTLITTNNRSGGTSGTGGRGGGRYLGATDGTNGAAGAGGGDDDNDPNGYDDGSDSTGSGYFGGGGGGGNAPNNNTTWTVNFRAGGQGNTYGFNGGYGGGNIESSNPIFGQSGRCPVDNSSTYPNFHAGGGRSYTQADGTAMSCAFNRGSAGGGGFPGGGGGASWYGTGCGNMGVGGDGASGIVVFEWTS